MQSHMVFTNKYAVMKKLIKPIGFASYKTLTTKNRMMLWFSVWRGKNLRVYKENGVVCNIIKQMY